ncbi:Tim10 DDP family zinc finger [Trypanosoma vivax]|uniref:Tim10-like domain-containing protein n=1 Tax=Trypanosoma vivax (strain Y486) TaxID=1055687 RepID=G0TVW2_TRYVY|nr:Tim10 DDP family zinc finger [Trypanosoma vivax]CCC48078.1 conserved hypothetical protein [Trypanosoma vivax Y486]
MQAQMALMQSMERYTMLDLSFGVLEQCWDICYDRNLAFRELADGSISESKLNKMEACQRKCIARHFEVMRLMNGAREQRDKEMMQGLPPGSLSMGV